MATVQWMDTSKYGAAEPLIVNVDWTADGQDVVYQVQDREQTWLDLNLGDADRGTTAVVLGNDQGLGERAGRPSG